MDDAERLAAIAALVDEATGYSVPYKRGRFMPIDSAFTNALKEALGVSPGRACVPASTCWCDGPDCGQTPCVEERQ